MVDKIFQYIATCIPNYIPSLTRRPYINAQINTCPLIIAMFESHRKTLESHIT